MSQQIIIKILRLSIVIGLSLILIGHYLLVSDYFDAINSINKIIISASCIAFGVLFSLPTKIYLTLLLMNLETNHEKPTEANTNANNK
jgi:hypothetical protein